MPSSGARELERFALIAGADPPAAELTGITDDDPEAAQWIVRIVLSLAYWPMANSRIEQEMIGKRFVAARIFAS